MRVHVFQHVPFEDLAAIEFWLKDHDAQIEYTRFYQPYQMPALKGLDLLIILGGPMSVNDETEFPWLTLEKKFIQNAIKRNVPMLGICLGAQLIAAALSSRVYRNREKEIGWFPIHAVDTDADVFRFPATATVFHWHGETFDLPAGATLLAKSEGCENQAFQFHKNVLALQFHVESTPASVAGMISTGCHELVPGPYIQSQQTIYSAADSVYKIANRVMADVLAYITREN